jgi:hypothetical protein
VGRISKWKNIPQKSVDEGAVSELSAESLQWGLISSAGVFVAGIG